jgi:hypothetical protein
MAAVGELTAVLAHGGVAGAAVEVAFALMIAAVALAAWIGTRRDRE